MWTIWIFVWFPLVIGSFAVFEAYAIKHKDRQWTLSKTIATAGAKWPLSIALWGMFFGSLLTHFFWPYCPEGISLGSLYDILQ